MSDRTEATRDRCSIRDRRALLGAGLGFGLAAVLPRKLSAQGLALPKPAATVHPPIRGTKIRDLTGPIETGPFSAPWTDLGIPALCPDGTLFFACGDTFTGPEVFAGDWLAPVGLRSSHSQLDEIVIDDSVGGAHAVGLVNEPHINGTTAIPSDVFTIGGTMYMHLMRGPIFDTHHTDFWRSDDNGETWQYLCQWPGGQHFAQFQQKTYAVAEDGYCYVLSSRFNRQIPSGLLLHRVPHAQVGNPAAYEPWGFVGIPGDGEWDWGNPPTSITHVRRWGEICYRRMGDGFVFTWLNMDPLGIRAQVLPSLYSDFFEAQEQTIIVPCDPGAETSNHVASPYGPFILPGATLSNFQFTLSQWYGLQNYRVMQYRISGLQG